MDFGFNFIRLWFSEFYIIDFGTFFLKKADGGERRREAGEARHLITAWLGLALIWWIALFLAFWMFGSNELLVAMGRVGHITNPFCHP